ncbi:MAG: diiron oxygenase [Deltaproteobacteria bacterium]|nr:diiron oxygenase [Deltaproteobacteria bacterium]MBI3293332.1 diiron oxygenase [Deltaproteobacteria bacterium]
MATNNCHAFDLLSNQISRQKKYAWDLERDLPWELGVDPDKFLLPLDENAIVFPGLDDELRLALSQFAGLFVNTAISEMEGVIDKLRDCAWRECLRRNPVNPELETLGELFFDEELKHSRLFKRFNLAFCDRLGIDPKYLQQILPQTFGSRFLDTIIDNAKDGGHAFWWVVASVEEVSIGVFRQMASEKAGIDPLFFEVHRRHMEEEMRHCNYAFLILDLIHKRSKNLRQHYHARTDLILAQTSSSTWLLGELQKMWRVQKMGSLHPFFTRLVRVVPHFKRISPLKLPHILYASSPYLSLFLNLRRHPLTLAKAIQTGTPHLPMPRPHDLPVLAKSLS